MPWQFNRTEAVFIQIADRLRSEIVSGKYPAGEQIPTVRSLAFEAAVNPNTVQKALLMLESEGLLHAHGTVGRFVTSDISVLDKARAHMQRETVCALIAEARSLGISREDLIKYIEEEDNIYGSAGPDMQKSDEKL